MTNEEKIAELEKRVKDLESRPHVVVYLTIQVPPWPYNQPYPWPQTWCSGSQQELK